MKNLSEHIAEESKKFREVACLHQLKNGLGLESEQAHRVESFLHASTARTLEWVREMAEGMRKEGEKRLPSHSRTQEKRRNYNFALSDLSASITKEIEAITSVDKKG